MQHFFVHADNRYKFAVQVHPTQRAMLAALQRIRGFRARRGKRIRALCLKFLADEGPVGKTLRAAGVLGTVFIQRRDVDDPVVVHELGHAALHWAAVRRLDLSRKPHEERYAEALERLFREYRGNAGGKV